MQKLLSTVRAQLRCFFDKSIITETIHTWMTQHKPVRLQLRCCTCTAMLFFDKSIISVTIYTGMTHYWQKHHSEYNTYRNDTARYVHSYAVLLTKSLSKSNNTGIACFWHNHISIIEMTGKHIFVNIIIPITIIPKWHSTVRVQLRCFDNKIIYL